MFCVYRITNTVNGKVYIGKTDDMCSRWVEHVRISRHPNDRNYHLIHKAISKYGVDNFTIDTLEQFDNELDALSKEMYWIDHHQSNVSVYGSRHGYNLTAGGEGISGFRHSEEAKQKMSEDRVGEKNAFYGKSHTDETKQMISNHHIEYYTTHPGVMFGKKHSDQSRQLMSDSKKGAQVGENNPMYGRVRSQEEKDKIRQTRRSRESSYNYPLGSAKKQAKLTEDDVVKIRTMILEGIADTHIGNAFGVSRKAISHIRQGKTWKHVP